MNHRKITSFLLFVMVLFSPGLSRGQQPPNIVLIVVDDYGWTDAGCYGSTFYETPNIDRLAASGVRFTQAYSACTVCSPSRAALMTGKYPARLHLTDWIKGHQQPYAKLQPPDWTMYLPTEETTIAELLGKQRYTTAAIGKWHLGDEEEYYPENQGFDVNAGGYSKGSPNSYFSPYDNPRLSDGPQGEQLTDRLTEEAVRFITAQKEGPFFLYLPFYAVHTPLQAKEEDINYFEGRIDTTAGQQNPVYAGLIKNMDRNIGKLMSCLRRLNLTENTLVIFTSDNGGLIGNRTDRRKQVTSNYPLREGKGTAYEGGVRIPAIFSWEGRIKPGVSAAPVISMDIFSTIAAAANIAPREIPANDGLNLLPLLTGGEPLPQRSLYWHYPHYHSQGATPYSAVLKDNKKLIYFYQTGKKELYDLQTDIGEQRDLSAAREAETAGMFRDLEQWLDRVDAQFPVDNPAVSTHEFKHVKGQALKLDVYMPAGAGNRRVPAIVLFHGGGLVSGVRSQMNEQCIFFAKRGIAAITADYRLLPKNAAQDTSAASTCIKDAKSAIRWVKAHAAEFGIDTSRILLGGGSAGGFLATAAALNKDINEDTDNLDISTTARALILFNPAYTPVKRYSPPPARYISSGAPPAVLFYGDKDKFKLGGDEFFDLLQQAGVPSELWLAGGEHHGFFNKQGWKEAVNRKAYDFLIRNKLVEGEYEKDVRGYPLVRRKTSAD